MILRTSLAALALSAFSVGAPAFAQDARLPEVSYPRFSTDELALTNYVPKTDVDDLMMALYPLYSRSIEVISPPNGSQTTVAPRLVNNLTTFGGALLIYDEPAQVDLILKAAAQLEKIAAGASDEDKRPRNPALDSVHYEPRFISLGAAQRALSPFQRTVRYVDSSGYEQGANNISPIDEIGTLVLRDEPETIRKMEAVLATVDKPAPQVLLVAQLLTPSGMFEGLEGSGRALPKDLTDNLSELVGFESFDVAAMSAIRTSAASGDSVRVQLEHAVLAQTFELNLNMSAFDAATGTLSVDSSLSQTTHRAEQASLINTGTRQLFRTSCSITSNEFTVLGSIGRDPLFCVLRITPVGGDAK